VYYLGRIKETCFTLAPINESYIDQRSRCNTTGAQA
jgi:hypothetical protein